MPEENDEGYKYTVLEGQWWFEEEWLFPPEDPDQEPSTYQMIHDFIINKVVPCAKCVEVSSRFLPRTIVIEAEHPKRGNEYARIILSPTDVREGRPDVEPDLVIHIKYYDLVRVLRGDLDIMDPLFQGAGWLIGNIVSGYDLKDLMDVAHGRELVPRAKAWPIGHP
ncbi:MAG: hypothetical protein HWN65_05390 [Candidatus Helarchaeota archaeon]|nr:hypothetical protein [Candidatus Helarchaeota archaeon]